jgi:diphthine synthase
VGSLTFVGLGLHDVRDVSVKGFELVRAADEVFLEAYTSRLAGARLEDLEAFYGRPVTLLARGAVEDGHRVLRAAAKGHVCFLAIGDSMAATTHVDLRVRAAREGIPTRVVHGASIVIAAAGLLGLQSYKFGRATTLAFPHGAYLAESPYEVVVRNKAQGLHTLALLDLDVEGGRFMTANEGLRQLLEVARRRGEATLRGDTLACVVARAGSEQPLLRAGPMAKLADEDFGLPLHALVIPGDLHFQEEEALRILAAWR